MGKKRYLLLVPRFRILLMLASSFNVSVYVSNEDDPHFGRKLGEFHISGHTRITDEDTDSPVFLKMWETQ